MNVSIDSDGNVVVVMSADQAQTIVNRYFDPYRPGIHQSDGAVTTLAKTIAESIEFLPIPRVEAKMKAKVKNA